MHEGRLTSTAIWFLFLCKFNTLIIVYLIHLMKSPSKDAADVFPGVPAV